MGAAELLHGLHVGCEPGAARAVELEKEEGMGGQTEVVGGLERGHRMLVQELTGRRAKPPRP